MEHPEEALRLDVKTDPDLVKQQAAWCGIGPGSRVLDVGCGSGIVTSIMHEIVQPGGSVVGIDFSKSRIEHARKNYGERNGIDFLLMDFTKPMESLGQFDYIWVRFVLEYFMKDASDIIKNLISCLKTQGRLCLLDLDYNCLSHHPLPGNMEAILSKLSTRFSDEFNFDPYVGRKLYTYLYDLGFLDIDMHLMAHHLIYGDLRSQDHFNWLKKLEMASRKAEDLFREYPDGYDGFFRDFEVFFRDPRRFTYTPLIMCKGKKPEAC